MTPYRVQAYNTAHDSENKIHDDAVARQFGFTGALVPGVDVYAYMMHMPVARWGREFLERGAARCKFSSPVYDGDTAEVTEQEESGGFGIEVRVNGKLCATGGASLPLPDSDKPRMKRYPLVPLPAPEERAPASAASLARGTVLGTFSLGATDEFVRNYLRDVRETDELYRREGLVHPGTLLRMCNHALVRNVKLGPWIHVGSSIANHGVARIGETLASRARVARNHEHKGHLFVDLDVLVLSNERPVAQVLHTAIYQPRQAARVA
jgi:acyl dehydratase